MVVKWRHRTNGLIQYNSPSSLFIILFCGGGGRVGRVIGLDFVSVHKNAKTRAMSIKQAWSILVNFQCIYIQLNLDKGQNMVALMRFGISRFFSLYFIIMYHSIPKPPTPLPAPTPTGGHTLDIWLEFFSVQWWIWPKMRPASWAFDFRGKKLVSLASKRIS